MNKYIGIQPLLLNDRSAVVCAPLSAVKNVYAFDYEINKPVVVASQACMVGCATCAAICAQDAIEFPSQGYIRKMIKEHKVLAQSKNMLKADPEKIDVRKRVPLAG